MELVFLYHKELLSKERIRTLQELILSFERSPGPEVIKHFSCSTQQRIKFILLIEVKIPIMVGILTYISMINTIFERLKARVGILVFMSSCNFMLR